MERQEIWLISFFFSSEQCWWSKIAILFSNEVICLAKIQTTWIWAENLNRVLAEVQKYYLRSLELCFRIPALIMTDRHPYQIRSSQEVDEKLEEQRSSARSKEGDSFGRSFSEKSTFQQSYLAVQGN